MKKTVKFSNYSLNYYFKPGLNLSDNELREMHRKINIVNEKSKDFKYGLFDKSLSFEDLKGIYSQMLICLIELNDEPEGFFYNYIIDNGEDKPIVHLGLVLIAKNIGNNLLYYPYLNGNKILLENFKDGYFVTNISSTPKIIGEVTEAYDNVWPSPKSNLVVRPRKYDNIVKKLKEEYILRFFPMSEEIEIDMRRYVLKNNAREMNFECNMRSLAKDPRLNYNLFCMFWLDYNGHIAEDLIQVGEFNQDTLERNLKIMNKLAESK